MELPAHVHGLQQPFCEQCLQHSRHWHPAAPWLSMAVSPSPHALPCQRSSRALHGKRLSNLELQTQGRQVQRTQPVCGGMRVKTGSTCAGAGSFRVLRKTTCWHAECVTTGLQQLAVSGAQREFTQQQRHLRTGDREFQVPPAHERHADVKFHFAIFPV